jgi:hypothetical protein
MYKYFDGKYYPQSDVIDKHPFYWLDEINKEVSNCETILLSWQEISEEDYNFYQNLDL